METIVKKEEPKNKVFVFHSELKTSNDKRSTIVGIVDEQSSHIDIGVSVCGPNDQYHKKLGKIIAEGRAQKDRSRFCSLNVKDKSKLKETFIAFATKLTKIL